MFGVPNILDCCGLEGRIDERQSLFNKEVVDVAISARQALVAARTSPEKKAKFAALAASRGMRESALLTLLLDAVLEQDDVSACAANAPADAATERVSLRLRPGDRRRVDTRAAARNMKCASYLVALIRAHVRHDAPLPTAELNALKVAVGQLSAVGRNLNQLVHASHAGAAPVGELLLTLRETVARVEDVRRYVTELVRSNLISWEIGDA